MCGRNSSSWSIPEGAIEFSGLAVRADVNLPSQESNGLFIDYDGYGSMLTEQGKFVGSNIRPSAVNTLLQYPDVAYILWYNR